MMMTVYDQNGKAHTVESVDAREYLKSGHYNCGGTEASLSVDNASALNELQNVTLGSGPGDVESLELLRAEFKAEVDKVRAEIEQEQKRLNERAAELHDQAEKQNKIEADHTAERQRLEALAASLEAKGNDVTAHMTVPQIKDALTAKGIEIPAGANKAELLALLNPAA